MGFAGRGFGFSGGKLQVAKLNAHLISTGSTCDTKLIWGAKVLETAE